MMPATQGEKTSGGASPDAREPPTMKPFALARQSEGFAWREAFVRLPPGQLLEDLLDVPGVWKGIQNLWQTQARRYDRVTCVAHDGSWAVKDIMVVAADNTKVILALKPSDRITLPPQLPTELIDDRAA